jgi:hypothetical protein
VSDRIESHAVNTGMARASTKSATSLTSQAPAVIAAMNRGSSGKEAAVPVVEADLGSFMISISLEGAEVSGWRYPRDRRTDQMNGRRTRREESDNPESIGEIEEVSRGLAALQTLEAEPQAESQSDPEDLADACEDDERHQDRDHEVPGLETQDRQWPVERPVAGLLKHRAVPSSPGWYPQARKGADT